jgi:hypothetical protein
LRQYFKTLLAVIGGNFLYFVVLQPVLPPAARHRLYQVDWGLVIDFWVCLACYGLLTLVFKNKPK